MNSYSKYGKSGIKTNNNISYIKNKKVIMVKIFTDIDQSKKLAKILPLDSADMYL